MVKTFSTAFRSHLDQETMTLATLYLITRQDSVQQGFTSFNTTITFDGIDYEPLSVTSISDAEQDTGTIAGNFELSMILDALTLSEDDLVAGLYDSARLEVFKVNYNNLPSDIDDKENMIYIGAYYMGEVRATDAGIFHAQMRGLKDRTNVKTGETYSPRCRVKKLGDARCKLSLGSFSINSTITSVVSSFKFRHTSNIKADHNPGDITYPYFRYGTLTFTSGANNGKEFQIKEYTNEGATGLFELVEATGYEMQVGDTFTAVAGCDRRWPTCKVIFNNLVNFRGEPPNLLPGMDEIMRNRS